VKCCFDSHAIVEIWGEIAIVEEVIVEATVEAGPRDRG
jgi:hypothetical protein